MTRDARLSNVAFAQPPAWRLLKKSQMRLVAFTAPAGPSPLANQVCPRPSTATSLTSAPSGQPAQINVVADPSDCFASGTTTPQGDAAMATSPPALPAGVDQAQRAARHLSRRPMWWTRVCAIGSVRAWTPQRFPEAARPALRQLPATLPQVRGWSPNGHRTHRWSRLRAKIETGVPPLTCTYVG
jgi:hypothetical protein